MTIFLDCDPEGENGMKQALGYLAQLVPVRLAWTSNMHGGKFKDRQPESLADHGTAVDARRAHGQKTMRLQRHGQPRVLQWCLLWVRVRASAIIVQGIVTPDGTLQVSEKLNVSPGPVQVTVQSVTEPSQPDRFWKMMQTIWADLEANGRTPRTREQIDADIQVLRDEAEEEVQAVESLQDQCRRARDVAQAGSQDK